MQTNKYNPEPRPKTEGVEKLTRQRIRHEMFEMSFATITYRRPDDPHANRRKAAREASKLEFRMQRDLPEPKRVDYSL